MEKDISCDLIDNIIYVIRKNFQRFSNNHGKLSRQLYNVEYMRLSNIPEKYILKSLFEYNALIIDILKELNEEEIVKEIMTRLTKILN